MFCKNCGKEIDDKAIICPGCGVPVEGAKKKKKHPILGTILLIFSISIIVGALSSNSQHKKVATNGQDNKSIVTETTKPENNKFTVGDAVELNGITVTLVDVSESNGSTYLKPESSNVFIICEFKIENNSKKDIAVSSLLSFETYVDEYTTNISLSAIGASDKGQLDGTVAAGKKMNGTIGYEASKNWKEIEIRFTPNFWAGQDIIFTYTK